MSNHPNRGASACQVPSPEQIRALRLEAGLTQTDAAELVCSSLRRWQEWEAGDSRMHPGLWRYFRLQVGQLEGRDMWCVVASTPESGDVYLVEYMDLTREAVEGRVQHRAAAEGYRGSVARRLQGLGWEIVPVKLLRRD